jgi:CBS-domain-containing membrane protein
MKLSDIMRTDFETVSPGSGIRQAATGLHGQIPECLLVVDKNQLVGVLTSSDFLGITITLLQEREQEQEEPKFSDLGEDAEIEELNEGDLAGVFIEKTEDEDWDRLDL